jgi:RNA polymerase sigma-70 factor (ECF subfamily)
VHDRLAADLDDAFPDLVRGYQDAVFTVCLRTVGDHHDAEDLTQDTFVRAYGALRRYSPDRVLALALRPWLMTIALNACRNRLRDRARRPAGTPLAEFDGVASESPEPDDAARWLAVLPAAQRTAVVLHHVVGLPYEEVAAATGVPIGTVKARVHRGVVALRTALSKEELW